MLSEQFFDRTCSAIPDSQPDEFGWTPVQQTACLKIGILGNNHKTLLLRIFPYFAVIRISKSDCSYVGASLVQFIQNARETWREILIE